MLLHTIGKLGKAGRARPVHRQIYLSRLSPALAQPDRQRRASGARLIASDVEMLRLHYAYTLRHGSSARSRPATQDRQAMYDERFFRMWEFYLAGGIVDVRNGAVLQLPGAICPRPPRAADHPRLYDRGRAPLSRDGAAQARRRRRRRVPAGKARAKASSLTLVSVQLGEQAGRRIDRASALPRPRRSRPRRCG